MMLQFWITQGPDVLPQPPPQETIARIHHMVMDDWLLTFNEQANAVGISREQVEKNLNNKRGVSKISAWWMVRLTHDQKHTRLVMSHVIIKTQNWERGLCDKKSRAAKCDRITEWMLTCYAYYTSRLFRLIEKMILTCCWGLVFSSGLLLFFFFFFYK